jgi:hypothetical protein
MSGDDRVQMPAVKEQDAGPSPIDSGTESREPTPRAGRPHGRRNRILFMASLMLTDAVASLLAFYVAYLLRHVDRLLRLQVLPPPPRGDPAG